MHHWNVYRSFDLASQAAADFLAQSIQQSIQKNDSCHVVLPGGNTPAQCLAYLAEKKLSWQKIFWYLGDERCYPVDHPERNDVMLQKNLWSRIDATQVYPIPAELGAEQGAEQYRKIMEVIDVDIAFLGLGEDGHTASLFPQNKALKDMRSVVPVYNSPKAPAERVSLGVTKLKQATSKIVLVSGAAKAEIIARIKKAESLPVNMLGDINWFIDEAAAG